jgi:hypothetical protein
MTAGEYCDLSGRGVLAIATPTLEFPSFGHRDGWLAGRMPKSLLVKDSEVRLAGESAELGNLAHAYTRIEQRPRLVQPVVIQQQLG